MAVDVDQDYLWRTRVKMPERARIFDRSYCEDVLVGRRHPEILAAWKAPRIRRQEGLGRATLTEEAGTSENRSRLLREAPPTDPLISEISEARRGTTSRTPLGERRNRLRMRGNRSPTPEVCVLLTSMEATTRIRDLVAKEHRE